MLILPTGGKGIGVEAEGSNFPFVQPSYDIQGLLADLWLAHEYHDVVLPLRVTHLIGFQQAFDGQQPSAQIVITDAADVVVFNSNGAIYSQKPWGPRLWIHEWLFTDGYVCRVVQHCAVPEPRPSWPNEIVPGNGVLDERTSELLPLRVVQLSDTTGATITDMATFVNGYNVEITNKPYPEPLRNTTVLTFSADPGKGWGRAPGCQDTDLLIRTISGIGPDTRGNFTLAAGDCYYARQPVDIQEDGTAVPVASTLNLGNDCDPCCDCDAFVNVQKAILNIEVDLRAAAALAEATRDSFVLAKDRWNEQKECRESQAVGVVATTAASLYADVSIVVCNVTPHCMVDVQVSIKVETQPTGSWSVVPGTTYISHAGQSAMVPYQLTGPFGNVMNGWISAINPQSSGRIKTRLVWTHVMPPGTMLTVTATAYDSNSLNTSFPQTTVYTMLMT